MKTKAIVLTLLLAISLFGLVFAGVLAAPQEATIMVNSTADTLVAGDNECTLREAINNANNNSDTTSGDCAAGTGADIIDLPAGTYTLTIAGGDENNNATGDLDILDSLTINGSGALSTTISGNNLDRVLHVQGVFNQVILNDLAVANGFSTLGISIGGGGIYNQDATLTLNDCIVHDNTVQGSASANGGGLYNVAGFVTLNGTTVQNNNISSTGFWGGGGLANLATLNDATMILNSSVVTSNDAPGGGGILSYADSNVTATLSISRSMVIGNVAGPTDGGGGGIWSTYNVGSVNQRTILTIQESTIADNEATGTAALGVGGGVWALYSDLLIVSTTFMSNSIASTASPGGYGGGLTLVNSQGTVVNSTISGNTATGTTSPDNGIGGGLALLTTDGGADTYNLINTTIAGNSADEAGGGFFAGEVGGGGDLTLTFVNTLLANNLAPVGTNCYVPYGPPELVSLGHNLEDDDTCQFDQPSDQIHTDPLLGPLQDNGGATWTHALQGGSPAINAGDDPTCLTAPVNGVDQRGVTRPQGVACDSGAFEQERELLSVDVGGNGNGAVSSEPAGVACQQSCTADFLPNTVVTLTATADLGSTFTGWSGACSGTAVCVILMDMSQQVTATFTLNQYELAVGLAGTGGGVVTSDPAGIDCGLDCMELYDFGAVITLMATADLGSIFAAWSGLCSGTAVCLVTISTTQQVTATFDLTPQYELTVALAGTGSGSVTSDPAGIDCGLDCAELYEVGTVITLTATADTGSTFSSWGGACAGVSEPTCPVTVDAETAVTATFTVDQPSYQIYLPLLRNP